MKDFFCYIIMTTRKMLFNIHIVTAFEEITKKYQKYAFILLTNAKKKRHIMFSLCLCDLIKSAPTFRISRYYLDIHQSRKVNYQFI
ncbi:MAG: hypothetical protein EAY65_04945 [Alphaproteobacteria bacterium]|nr:MAG: hypothetical protein EAY65_04945 [Alphaproteobacteria bacterium]